MLALVSFTSTVYPSLIGTRPPSLLFLSKHIERHARTSTCTGREARTYTSVGAMGTSGGAHPMHRQTFPGEHQRNHQRGFKQPSIANTNTYTHVHKDTHTHTRLPTPEVKARSNEQREQRASFFGLRGIAALKVDSLSTGADFHRCGRFIYTIFVCISPWQVPQPTGRHDDGGQAAQGASRKTNVTCLAFNRRRHTVWTVCQKSGIKTGILRLLRLLLKK